MAIELTKEKKLKAPFWIMIVSLAVIIVLAALVASYIFFYAAHGKIMSKIEEIDSSAVELNKNIEQRESELSFMQKKVNDFKRLISRHYNLVNVFKFLEGKTIANIWFNGFEFSSVDNDVVILNGIGPSFMVIGQQIEILKKEDVVKDIYLNDVSINDEGDIVFELKVGFGPEIFSFKKD